MTATFFKLCVKREKRSLLGQMNFILFCCSSWLTV